MPHQLVNDVELYYEDTGGDGEVVLLHHGYTGSGHGWAPIVEHLRDRWRCIVVDCRGAGQSSRPEAGYDLPSYAADVIGLADALGIDRFTFVGHSMGGGIGMWLGLEHPDRVERLVLTAAIPSGGLSGDPAPHEASRALWEAGDAEEMLRQRRLMAARPEVWDEEAKRLDVERALAVSAGHYDLSWVAMQDFDVTDRLGSLTTPTLVVAGAADALVRANVEDWLRLPNASLHVFHRVGHNVPADVPDAYAEVVADFLTHGVVLAADLQARLTAPAPAAR